MAEDSTFTSTSGFHPAARQFGFDVAPTTADSSNTLRRRLFAQACWRMNKSLFDFDSSVIRPEVAADLDKLRRLVKANPGTLAAVFGHADPSGSDDLNKTLSGRRARAVFALLTRDVAVWEELFSKAEAGDQWGLRSTQLMLATLKRAEDAEEVERVAPGAVYYAGPIDGAFGPGTERGIRAFQTDNELAVDGIAGPDTRKVLYELYMDAVCVAPDDPFSMKPEDFVGEGADPGGKGAVQGCSEFNPVLVFSKSVEQEFKKANKKTERDARNAPNRRVVIFLFAKDVLPPLASWPCPLAKEGAEGCKKQFFDDADRRRNPGDVERRYSDARDTMACRFYDRFARASPCEGGTQFHVLQGRITLAQGGPAANMPFVVKVGGQVIDGGFTDEEGNYRVVGVAGLAEITLCDRLPLAKEATEPGRELVAVQARPERPSGDPNAPGDDDDDTAVA